jgi:hypothetical protein
VACGGTQRASVPYGRSAMRSCSFVHVGVAALLGAATVAALGTIRDVGAVDSNPASTFVPITPCRLADTRADSTVGGRSTPIGAAESVTFAVWGVNGNCTIPSTATGIATNVTIDNPNADSYLTVYPADASPRPTASNLNFTATSSPTPNQVTVGLSAAGAIAAYNNGGTVDVIIDIVGYYQSADVPEAPIQQTVVLLGESAVLVKGAGTSAGINGCFGMDGLGVLVIPVALPAGATITGAVAKYLDSGAGTVTLSLRYANVGVALSAASADAASVDGSTSAPLSLVDHPSVSSTAAYFVQAAFSGGSGFSLKLCGAEVTYTLPS